MSSCHIWDDRLSAPLDLLLCPRVTMSRQDDVLGRILPTFTSELLILLTFGIDSRVCKLVKYVLIIVRLLTIAAVVLF